MDGAPWTFNKQPLLLERLKRVDDLVLMRIETIEIWIQVYDLRASFISEIVLKAVGEFLGGFVSSCLKNFTGTWKEFLRV